MFEDEVDGSPRPCEHPLRWYHGLAHWAHERVERMTFIDRQKWHDRLPTWVCEAYERVEFDFPCFSCEADRDREYGATTKSDADVIARFPPMEDPLAFDEDDEPRA